MSSDTIIIEANFDLAAWSACKRTWVLTSYCLFVLWATKEFFSPLFNLVIGLNIAVFTSLSFTSVLPFSIFYGFISLIIKYDIDPVTGSTFIKNSAKQSFSNNSKCLLITSQTLNNSHLINFTRRGLGNGICSMDIFLEFFCHGCFVCLTDQAIWGNNDHGRGPRGWDNTSLIFKFLLSAMTIIWAKNLLSVLRITSWFWPALTDVFLFR